MDNLFENDKFKKDIMRLWNGVCSIYKFENTVDEYGITKCVKCTAAENVPCRFSYKTYKRDRAGEQGETVDALDKEVRLILGAEVEIEAGYRVEVTQNGVTRSFAAAGIPAVYGSHKEVMVCDEAENA